MSSYRERRQKIQPNQRPLFLRAPALVMTASLCLAEAARLAMLDWGFQTAHIGVLTVRLPAALGRQLDPQIASTEQVGVIAATLVLACAAPLRGLLMTDPATLLRHS